MKITIVKQNELMNVMQDLNIVKVKFRNGDNWIIALLLYVDKTNVEILFDSPYSENLLPYQEAILKFRKEGYEYLVSGEVTTANESNPKVATLRVSMAQKYSDLRKYMRFDSNLKVILKTDKGNTIESVAKNISRGGAMIVAEADIELGSVISFQIASMSGNRFTALAKLIRKSPYREPRISYGIEFIEISEDSTRIFNKEILKYEKQYLKSLNTLRDYTRKAYTSFSAKITILCYGKGEDYNIREGLMNLGAENYEVFYNFRFYTDFFTEEKPKIVIVDTEEISEAVQETIRQIDASFPHIKIILLHPICGDNAEKEDMLIPDNVSNLYKPLIYNEFETELMKYL